MYRNDEQQQNDVIELGAVSAETKGSVQPEIDSQGGFLGAGLAAD